jgi:gliding motility-associated-like protein
MKKFKLLILALVLYANAYSQCGVNVPNIVIDLSSTPDTTWVLTRANAPNRNGQCCGVGTNESCISFTVTLNENAAGIFFTYDGAPAYGSLGWRIDCGPTYNMRDTICVTDKGPFTLTFCKPGTDNGNYTLISVAKPTFPGDQTVPANCEKPLEILGVTAQSPTWTSISPGAVGQYNNLLSCTDCLEPVFKPAPGMPSEVEYRVCGYPTLDYCVGKFIFCDTVKFTILDSLKLSVGDDFKFCEGGNVNVSASASGGDGSYTFLWYNNAMQQIGTGNPFNIDAAGTYTVEVRDGNYIPGYCDDFRKTFTVSESAPPSVDAGDDQILCAESPNAALKGIVENAGGGIWSGGAGTFIPSNTQLATTYVPTATEIGTGQVTLRLSSTNPFPGCTNTFDELTLFFTDSIKITMANISLDCHNSTTTVNPTVEGGLAPLSFHWTNGATTQQTNLGGGTHCLTVTDANGCGKTKCITITVPSQLSVDVNSTPITTDGGSDGTATATPNGGTPGYTYLWNNAETTSSISGLSYGIYSVTVTDSKGCTATGSVVVNEPRCNGFFITVDGNDLNCYADNSGAATINVNGGSGNITFLWNDSSTQTTVTASSLAAGVYTAIAEDENGCLAVETVAITEPEKLSNNMMHTNVTIVGGNDGTATANVTGGTGAYTFVWSNGDNTATANNLTAGWHYVDIFDAKSCSLKDSVFISEPPCNTFNIYVGTKAVTCNGQSNGEAYLNIENGVGPFDIMWSNAQHNIYTITGLSGGVHTVEVTDSRGCYAFQSFGVAEPTALSLGLKATPSTCLGANNGTIDLTISGGTFPKYTFLWSNGRTTEDIINLGPGTYTVTVTDENGCVANAGATLSDPTQLEYSFTKVDASCFGYNDGSIDFTPSGGTVPYSYLWSRNNETTQDLSDVGFGTYLLDFKDANNCKVGEGLISISINQPDSVKASNIVVACPIPGETTTLLNITPIGGTASYSVSSNNGVDYGAVGEFELSLTTDNTYQIVVKDSRECLSETYTVVIDTNVYISDIDFNVCYFTGQTNEVVTITPSGGTANYSLSTNNGQSYNTEGDFALTLDVANTYELVAKDSKGCISETYTIELPEVITLTLEITSDYNGEHISCFGAEDGQITATMTGGATPYVYDWNNGETTAIISGLKAGNYTLNASDNNGCDISEAITLVNPQILNSTIEVTTDYNGEDISCHGASDATVVVNPTGGVAPYTYAWSNNRDTQTITGLPAGTYTVEYTDKNGCKKSNSITVTQPEILNISAVIKNVSCNGGNDGEIDITPTGGVLPYDFSWDHGPQTEDVVDLPAGTYAVTLTDANLCFFILENLVVDPTAIKLSVVVTDALCFGDANGAIDLSVEGGTPPYRYEWTNFETTEDITGLIIGTYTVVVTDDNDCFTDISGTVNQPDLLEISGVVSNVTCYEYSNGGIDATVVGGTEPYTYEWSNDKTTQDINNISKGKYSVYVEDKNGCFLLEEYTVTQPDELIAVLTSPVNFHDNNIDFHGGDNGAINTTVSGGTEPYFFDWSNGESTKDLSGLTAGEYILLLTDVNGCSYEVSISLTEPMKLELPTAFSPNNDGHNDTFFIRGIEAYPNNLLIITNRWGQVVYQEKGYNNTWAGTSQNGQALPDGTYFVILEIDGKQIIKNDFVELKRK